MPHRSEELEFIDRAEAGHSDLVANLEHMALANRLMGTSNRLVEALETILQSHDGARPLSWVDVGTGGGDIPVAVVRWARWRRLRLKAIVSDLSGETLAIARCNLGRQLTPMAADFPLLVQHDGCRIPFDSGSVDLVTCCHTLHHLDATRAIALLKEIERVSRLGFVILDLRRAFFTYWASRLLTCILGHRLSAHDGPLSVLRSFTRAELLALALDAGIPSPEIHEYAWQVMLLRSKTNE